MVAPFRISILSAPDRETLQMFAQNSAPSGLLPDLNKKNLLALAIAPFLQLKYPAPVFSGEYRPDF
jgi:hypothetical protein